MLVTHCSLNIPQAFWLLCFFPLFQPEMFSLSLRFWWNSKLFTKQPLTNLAWHDGLLFCSPIMFILHTNVYILHSYVSYIWQFLKLEMCYLPIWSLEPAVTYVSKVILFIFHIWPIWGSKEFWFSWDLLASGDRVKIRTQVFSIDAVSQQNGFGHSVQIV